MPSAPPALSAPPPPIATAPPADSLRQRAVRSSFWTLVGYGGGQVLRFAANLALTRLLFPEAFGTMAIINTLVIGLHLFSDVGVIPSIVQNKRGDDPAFLNTAFTIQAVRGLVLWLAALAMAWPAAAFYGKSELLWFIPLTATTAFANGLCSTKLWALQRHVDLKRLTLIELCTQLVASGVMVAWALQSPTLWALVAGTIAGEVYRTWASHRLPGPGNRLHWDPSAARAMFGFGRWVFLSTLLTFGAEQADRLILGKLAGDAMLGVYNIAFMLALLPTTVIHRLGASVFFPSFSRLLEQGVDLGAGFGKARVVLSSLGGFVVAAMIATGQPVMAFLYDERYVQAGWMLQLIATGTWFSILEASATAALLALGRVRALAASNLAKAVGVVVLLPVGYACGGVAGAILGLAAAQVLKYAIVTIAARAAGLPVLRSDLPLTAMVAATSGAGWLASQQLVASDGLAALAGSTVVALLWLPVGLRLWAARRG